MSSDDTAAGDAGDGSTGEDSTDRVSVRLSREQSELVERAYRAAASPALKGISEQLRRQQDDIAKSLVQVAASPALKGLSEQLRRQQDDIVRSLVQVAMSPTLEALRQHDTASLQQMFGSLGATPGLRGVREQNARIAVAIGRLTAASTVDPEPDEGQIGEAAALLTSMSEALPDLAEEGALPPESGTATAEVFAILVTLVWLSALLSLWLHEAGRSGEPLPADLNRWQLMNDLDFLVAKTGGAYALVRWLLLRLAAGRVFFRDVKPYAIVDDLDQLRGPAGGVVELSHSVLWAPAGSGVDLDEPKGTALAYQAVLAEGSVEDLLEVLCRDRLIAVWPDLMLDQRVRGMWESRFPELQRSTGASPLEERSP
jgi:hypothetical protein